MRSWNLVFFEKKIVGTIKRLLIANLPTCLKASIPKESNTLFNRLNGEIVYPIKDSIP